MSDEQNGGGIDREGWSEESLEKALEECVSDIGDSPSIKQYERWRKRHHPSHWAIVNAYGSWNGAKEELGISTYTVGHHPNYRLVGKERSECKGQPDTTQEAADD